MLNKLHVSMWLFVVKVISVIFRKIKTILILISFKRYFAHPEKSILKSSLTLRRHCNSRPRTVCDIQVEGKRRFLKGFNHIWVWWPSWSCDKDHLNKLSVPHQMESPYEL